LLLSGRDRPMVVVTSAYYPYVTSVSGQVQHGPENTAALIHGFRTSWNTLIHAHIPVIALRETPVMSQDVAECVSAHRDSLNLCTTPRVKALRTAHIMQSAGAGMPGVAVIDLTLTAVCPVLECPPVIGNVLVYRDTHHLTAEYARSLAPFLSKALASLRAQNFDGGALNSVLPALARPKAGS
jgi:hypothetical protein